MDSISLLHRTLFWQAGRHAIGWGLSRLAIALGATVLAAIVADATLVLGIVAVKPLARWGNRRRHRRPPAAARRWYRQPLSP
jgi:hypothetical protein